ncbi:hypothetical protein [uncultured Campylobacter sp.]|nr:hypothetical protein [uncultured Campylobacter sp.]
MSIAHLKNAPYTRVSGGERAYTRELLSIAAAVRACIHKQDIVFR